MAKSNTVDLITGMQRFVKTRTRERSLSSLDSSEDKKSRRDASAAVAASTGNKIKKPRPKLTEQQKADLEAKQAARAAKKKDNAAAKVARRKAKKAAVRAKTDAAAIPRTMTKREKYRVKIIQQIYDNLTKELVGADEWKTKILCKKRNSIERELNNLLKGKIID